MKYVKNRIFSSWFRDKTTKQAIPKSPFGGGMRKIILVSFIALFPILAFSQQPDRGQSPIHSYLQEAAQNNPELKVKYRQYLGALQQAPQVSTLPDPELSFGYFINPIETRVGPQQTRFGLTQMFPWFGTLNARGEAASQMAKAKFRTFQDARNQLFFKVQEQWYKLYKIEQTIYILRENIDILDMFESLVTQQYETDQVGQVDVLRVQIEKEDLKTRLELQKDNKQVAIQEFNELLNRPVEQDVVIPDSLNQKTLRISTEELEQLVRQQNPRLMKMDFEASSARSSIEAARKEGMPKFNLGIDYMITGERDMALTDNGKDAIVARGGIQIPLYRKKYRAREKQAEIQLRTVQDQQRVMENSLQTELNQALRDYHDGQRRLNLYKEIQIQRTQQTIDILTEQYTTSSIDLEELLRLQRKLLDYELAREQALVDQNTAVTRIEYLYGKHNANPEAIELE
ncbi:TolC family protein [Fodinibius sp. Rm-B-1B1-1]|uniref:TolC family protein n=1 Tax=Fodinibius alkaliphilus TaxID=3140241 RepID=UPI00315A0C4D